MVEKNKRRRNVGGSVLTVALLMAGGALLYATEVATAADTGEKIVKSVCVPCHRIEGKSARANRRRAKRRMRRTSCGLATSIGKSGWSRGSRSRSSNTILSGTTFVRNAGNLTSPYRPIRRRRSRNSSPYGKIHVYRRV